MAGQSARLQYEIRQAVILRLHRVDASKQHFALNTHIHLLTESRAAAYKYLIVGLKQEAVFVQAQTVVQLYAE